MGDPKGFLKLKRQHPEYRAVCERVRDYKAVSVLRAESRSMEQASRCMDCGTPFCHAACPIGNYIPEWNDLVFHGHWERALQLLRATNNLPEITGRVCPALCEYACVLGINDDAVTIRENELAIIEHGFKHNLMQPRIPWKRTGKKVAVIGSGPSGLACADQLNFVGHTVTVFEKDQKIGGILRYGIPDFKLEKKLLDRRIALLEKEGICFKTGIEAGKEYPAHKLLEVFDAVCLCGGSRQPRDLVVPGRELKGIHFAMEYLSQSNKRVSGEKFSEEPIHARDNYVVVIGGGDTGADCVGTAVRQGARCVQQIEVLPKPPECRTENMPWPQYPMILKTSTSHEEGGTREWAIKTKEFLGKDGRVQELLCSRLDFSQKDAQGCFVMQEMPGTEFKLKADLVILAVGFLHPEQGLLEKLKIEVDNRKNVKTNADFKTSIAKVFSAGDMRRGQSLVVWAISEGRLCARAVDKFLTGESSLPAF